MDESLDRRTDEALGAADYYYGNCSSAQQTRIEETLSRARAATTSPEFGQCLERSILRGLTTSFSNNTAYGYFGCANDHMVTGYNSERFWSAFDVAKSPNNVMMNCWNGGATVSAVRQSNGLHANPEELFWGSWLGSFTADPSLTAEGAGYIWREITRSHNYGEGDSTNNATAYANCAPSVPLSSGWQYDRNTMPNIVGACMRGVVSDGMSACASMRCGSGSYAYPITLPGGGPAECRCFEDPARWGDPQVIFYDRPTGYAQVGTIPVDQRWTYQADTYLAPGFTHAVGLRGGRRFFYNATNGTAAVVRVLSNGNLAVLNNLSGFSPWWDKIISLPNGLIVFYSNAGLVAWGEIEESQTFRQWGYTWGALAGTTSIAAGGYDQAVFTTGSLMATARITRGEGYQFQAWSTSIASYPTETIMGTGDGLLLAFNRLLGSWHTARVRASGAVEFLNSVSSNPPTFLHADLQAVLADGRLVVRDRWGRLMTIRMNPTNLYDTPNPNSGLGVANPSEYAGPASLAVGNR